MSFIVTVLIGVAVGVMVELLLPGRTASELLLAMSLGAAGALAARLIGERTGWFGTEQPESYVAAVLGAILSLVLYGLLIRRGRRNRS